MASTVPFQISLCCLVAQCWDIRLATACYIALDYFQAATLLYARYRVPDILVSIMVGTWLLIITLRYATTAYIRLKCFHDGRTIIGQYNWVTQTAIKMAYNDDGAEAKMIDASPLIFSISWWWYCIIYCLIRMRNMAPLRLIIAA